jgi:transposase-like protein
VIATEPDIEQRRRPRPEFTARIVVEVFTSDPHASCAKVAREHGLRPDTVCRWMREFSPTTEASTSALTVWRVPDDW